MRKPLVCLAAIAGLLGAGAAGADTTLVYDTGAGDFVVKIRPGEIRIDDASERWQLYRADKQTIYSVDPAQKSYVQMDKQAAGAIKAQMQTLRENMEKQLSRLSEAQQAQARAMMAQQVPGLGGEQSETTIEATGGTDTVAGKRCRKMQTLRDGKPQESLCVASAKTLGMAGAEFETVESMFSLMQSMLAGTGLEHIGLPYLSLDGMPVRYQDPNSGNTRTLKRISHESLPDLAFDIPASYTPQSPQIGR